MRLSTLGQVHPDPETVTAATEALPQIREYLSHHASDDPVRLAVDDEQGAGTLVLPRAAIDLLVNVLVHMAAGHAVSVIPANAELTTQQAADLLQVSRPYLISLLEAGELEYRLVGRHRRINAAALLNYKRRDDLKRRQAADELTDLGQEMGLI